jgi:diaminopimelate decarboxylase
LSNIDTFGLDETSVAKGYDYITLFVDLYHQAQDSKYLNVQGLDCHIGSQITEVSPSLACLTTRYKHTL